MISAIAVPMHAAAAAKTYPQASGRLILPSSRLPIMPQQKTALKNITAYLKFFMIFSSFLYFLTFICPYVIFIEFFSSSGAGLGIGFKKHCCHNLLKKVLFSSTAVDRK